MQLTYPTVADDGFAGLLADSGHDMFLISRALEDAVSMGFGLGVQYGTDPEKQFSVLDGLTNVLAGITSHKHNKQNPALTGVLGIVQDEVNSLVRRGRLWVVTEETVAVTDPVFVRVLTGSGTVIGAFRNDADGAAEVSTLTPNPVTDSIVYTVDVRVGLQDFHFETLSDATATATEICDGIRAAMALDALFTTLVVATGTTTLILTGQTAGEELVITSTGEGLFDIVETTPPAPTCIEVPKASWLKGGTGAGIALLELNIP